MSSHSKEIESLEKKLQELQNKKRSMEIENLNLMADAELQRLKQADELKNRIQTIPDKSIQKLLTGLFFTESGEIKRRNKFKSPMP